MFKSKTFLGIPTLNKLSISDIKVDAPVGTAMKRFFAEKNDILRTKDNVMRLFAKDGEILNKEVYEQIFKGETIEIEEDGFATEEEIDNNEPLDV